MAIHTKRRIPPRLASSLVTKATHTSDYREQLAECHIAELMALAEIEAGAATPGDLHRLHCLARIAQALNPAHTSLAKSVMTTLTTDHPNIELVRKLIDLHSVDRCAVTANVYQWAMQRGLTV